MPVKTRKQLKNNKSKKSRGDRKQRKSRTTKRGGIFGIPSMGVFKPAAALPPAAPKQSDEDKIRNLMAAGISVDQIVEIQKIVLNNNTFGGQKIRQILRNGDNDPGRAAADEVYKSKIRALVAVYGKSNKALYAELLGILHEA